MFFLEHAWLRFSKRRKQYRSRVTPRVTRYHSWLLLEIHCRRTHWIVWSLFRRYKCLKNKKNYYICLNFPYEITFLLFDLQGRLQACVSFVEHCGLDHKNKHFYQRAMLLVEQVKVSRGSPLSLASWKGRLEGTFLLHISLFFLEFFLFRVLGPSLKSFDWTKDFNYFNLLISLSWTLLHIFVSGQSLGYWSMLLLDNIIQTRSHKHFWFSSREFLQRYAVTFFFLLLISILVHN